MIKTATEKQAHLVSTGLAPSCGLESSRRRVNPDVVGRHAKCTTRESETEGVRIGIDGIGNLQGQRSVVENDVRFVVAAGDLIDQLSLASEALITA